jgi:hypothetical protein
VVPAHMSALPPAPPCALNRWPGQIGTPVKDYLRQWEASCAELESSSVLPARLREMLSTSSIGGLSAAGVAHWCLLDKRRKLSRTSAKIRTPCASLDFVDEKDGRTGTPSVLVPAGRGVRH